MAATIYQAFRIMFGLILAGFILYFFLSYSGVYGETEEMRIRSEIVKNFRSAINDVYETGIPIAFTQFGESNFEFELFLDAEYNPPINYPGIREASITGTVTMFMPVIFLPGDEVYLYRESVDLGWWNFYFIEALSDVAVIFVPVDSGDEVMELIEDIVDSMPSTSQVQRPKVTFGFCDGPTLYYEGLCDEYRCERYEFEDLIEAGYPSDASECTADLSDSHRLVTISQSCTPIYVSSGVCIEPPDSNDMGYAYIAGSSKSYVYKNMLDLMAIVIGGDESTVYGITGENYYDYENNIFTEHIRTASEMMLTRATLLEVEPGTRLECVPIYSEMKTIMTSVKNSLVSDYHENHGKVIALLSLFEQAEQRHQSLAGMGCEV